MTSTYRLTTRSLLSLLIFWHKHHPITSLHFTRHRHLTEVTDLPLFKKLPKFLPQQLFVTILASRFVKGQHTTIPEAVLKGKVLQVPRSRSISCDFVKVHDQAVVHSYNIYIRHCWQRVDHKCTWCWALQAESHLSWAYLVWGWSKSQAPMRLRVVCIFDKFHWTFNFTSKVSRDVFTNENE